MENIKVKVNNEAESREVQGLFFELGGDFYFGGKLYCNTNLSLVTINKSGLMANIELDGFEYKELTIPLLRDLVVLKRNDVGDANHIRPRDGKRYFVNSDKTRSYYMMDEEWKLTKWDEDQLHKQLKPIEKDMSAKKEYIAEINGVYRLVGVSEVVSGRIEVPQGSDVLLKAFKAPPLKDEFCFLRKVGDIAEQFINNGWFYCGDWCDISNIGNTKIVWQRPQKPEALPFVDDEPKGINKGLQGLAQASKKLSGKINVDKFEFKFMTEPPQTLNDLNAEIEQVRQEAHPVGICIPKENPNSLQNLKDNGFIADVAISDFKNTDRGKEFDKFDLMSDNVNHPAHYTQGGIECIDALEAATVGKKGIEAVCVANVMKYLWRYEEKNGIEDVKKARWYLDRLISHLD